MTQTIEVQPITATIGAEIHGIDLARPLSNIEVDAIHDALIRHQVIFFRDQDLDFASQKAFARRFGELHIHPAAKAPDGHPEILPIHADASSTWIAGERWHSDVSCDPEPPMGSILWLHTVPPVGGDTLFASMYAAYEALSPRMQAYLADLTARPRRRARLSRALHRRRRSQPGLPARRPPGDPHPPGERP
jgi:taurine dioxygenase